MKVTPFTDKPIKVLEYDGKATADLSTLGLSKDQYLSIYRWLVFVRAVDDRGYILVRQGRSGLDPGYCRRAALRSLSRDRSSAGRRR